MKGIDLAEEELEGAAGEQIGAFIPSDIVQRMELVGDGRESCADDCAILGAIGFVWKGMMSPTRATGNIARYRPMEMNTTS